MYGYNFYRRRHYKNKIVIIYCIINNNKRIQVYKMDFILNYVIKYGLIFIFLIVYLENINFPGLAAGIVYPAIGVLVLYGKYNLFLMFIVSLIASLLGSITLYILGYFIGSRVVEKLIEIFPKLEINIRKVMNYSERYGDKSVLICRFIPTIRTIIPLVSGTVKQEFIGFILYSAVGIGICNLVLIMSGYFTYRIIT